MTDIVLINPPRLFKEGNIWKAIDRSLPALGIAYCAAYLEKEGFTVKILDMQAEPITPDELKSILQEWAPKFAGLTATTVEINRALEVAHFVKENFPQTGIIFGGVHSTLRPEEILSHEFVDLVVRGEGEITLTELMKGRSLEDILGLSFKENGKPVHNKAREFIENIDDIPYPAHHLLPIAKYKPSTGNYKRLPAMSMMTSRGCPGKCTFCSTEAMGKRTRFRTPANIVGEMERLIKDYGIKEISFYDDTITAKRKNMQGMCELMLKRGLDITWSCMSRVDCIDQETLGLMKQAGCHQIGYGVESGDENILKNIKKHISLEKVKEVVEITKKTGLDVRCMFMFGNPGETKETLEKTVRLAIELDPDIVVFNITTPYPGTEMYDWAVKNGHLNITNWNKYDLANIVMNLPTVNQETITKHYHTAYKKFYLRPSYLLRRLLKIRTLNDLRNNYKSFFSMISFGRN
ncbi:MAG: radical SAM protein [bacterium]|nr:radical SAM protein [bacterium]